MPGCPEAPGRRILPGGRPATRAPSALVGCALALAAAGAGLLLGAPPGLGPGPTSGRPHPGGTWSLVAVDRETGDVGVAAATCLDYDVSALAALVPGRGAAVIQADFTLDHRNAALSRIQAGDTAAEVVSRLVGAGDNAIARRQFGVVTTHDSEAGVAGHSGADINNTHEQLLSGNHGVAVQGNTLVGKDVVDDALSAFAAADEAGHALADCLLAGLEAGSAAGGDFRCNTTDSRQTAASAFVMVARSGQRPFAVREMGTLESDWPERPWLHLSVVEDIGGANPVTRLRQDYEAWKDSREASDERSASGSGAGPGSAGPTAAVAGAPTSPVARSETDAAGEAGATVEIGAEPLSQTPATDATTLGAAAVGLVLAAAGALAAGRYARRRRHAPVGAGDISDRESSHLDR